MPEIRFYNFFVFSFELKPCFPFTFGSNFGIIKIDYERAVP